MPDEPLLSLRARYSRPVPAVGHAWEPGLPAAETHCVNCGEPYSPDVAPCPESNWGKESGDG